MKSSITPARNGCRWVMALDHINPPIGAAENGPRRPHQNAGSYGAPSVSPIAGPAASPGAGSTAIASVTARPDAVAVHHLVDVFPQISVEGLELCLERRAFRAVFEMPRRYLFFAAPKFAIEHAAQSLADFLAQQFASPVTLGHESPLRSNLPPIRTSPRPSYLRTVRTSQLDDLVGAHSLEESAAVVACLG